MKYRMMCLIHFDRAMKHLPRPLRHFAGTCPLLYGNGLMSFHAPSKF
jgi:hypothetical protein